MVSRQKAVYIKVDNMQDISRVVREIKKKQDAVRALFRKIEELSVQEQRGLDKWHTSLEELNIKLESVSC